VISDRPGLRAELPSPVMSRLFPSTLFIPCSLLAITAVLSGCPENTTPGEDVVDVSVTDVGNGDVTEAATFCELGTDVQGARVANGFCLRRFEMLAEPRALAFAPNGDLFVTEPSMFAPGGASGGAGAIYVLSDDNHDGVAERHVFLSDVPDVHGIAVGGGFVYYTTSASVFRVPYTSGQRASTATPENLNLPGEFGTGGRWTHGLARSQSGKILASRGQYSQCGGGSSGSIYDVGMNRMDTVTTGFRNPMYLRCHFQDEVCVAAELGEDQMPGATEKILVIRPETDYGYPCCYRQNVPAAGQSVSCSSITPEEVPFPIGDTPFGLDWERGVWSGNFRSSLFIALHGSFYTSPPWEGAAIVWVPTDPTTHAPTGSPTELVTGFGPGGSELDRPSDVTFAPDGRLFFSDDLGGGVYWVAPVDLPRQ
jgi:glucose/arabinose dehydrogenase